MTPTRPRSLRIAAFALLLGGALGVLMALSCEFPILSFHEPEPLQSESALEVRYYLWVRAEALLAGLYGGCAIWAGINLLRGRERARQAGMYLAFGPAVLAAILAWGRLLVVLPMMEEMMKHLENDYPQENERQLVLIKARELRHCIEWPLFGVVVAVSMVALLMRPAVKAYCDRSARSPVDELKTGRF